MNSGRISSSWWTLKIVLGLVALLAGADKFFNVLTNWTDYVNPAVFVYVPITPVEFVQCVGVIEMIVGIVILTPWTRFGAYLAAVWLAAIAVNLISMGKYYDVAVRDLVLSVTALTLARLSVARRAESSESEPVRSNVTEGGLLRLDL